MVFSSLLFMFFFLPISLFLYYIAPYKYRIKNFVLMVISLVFYSWGEVRYFPIMMALILTNYFSALLISKFDNNKNLRKLFLIIAIVVSLGMLAVFKYTDFFIANINSVFSLSIPFLELTLPLGISFYTFQTMGYTIDVYKKDVPVEKNIVDLAAFISMFPQLIAGPIVRYSDVYKELKHRKLDIETFDKGIEDFVIGLAKKVLIANNIGQLWAEVEALGFSSVSTGLAWLGVLAFTLQIYFDFSGYSQMAIGLGTLLGFKFPKNFDNPYSSRSATEFWRRWHITLGTWFKDYVYFPLGGSRCGKYRNIFNLFVVWGLTGLWHGASWNFVIWGLYYFILITVEKLWFMNVLNKYNIFSRLYMILVTLIGWTIFAITDFSSLLLYLQKMFVPTALFADGASFIEASFYLRNYIVIIVLGIFFSLATSSKIYSKVRQNNIIRTALMIILFVISVAYLVDSTFNPFLYFRF